MSKALSTILSPPQLDAMRRGELSMLVVRVKKPNGLPHFHRIAMGDGLVGAVFTDQPELRGSMAVALRCPLGRVGGEIVCKERFHFWTEFNTTPTRDVPSGSCINFPDDGNKWDARIRPAREMPLEYARFTLRLLSVEVRKVNTITEDEARESGLSKLTKDGGRTWKYGIADRDGLPGNDNIGWHWAEWEVSHADAFKKIYKGDFATDFAWFARVELIDTTQPQPASAAGEGGER